MDPIHAIAVERVSKRYGTGDQAVKALTDVTLRIGSGEFVSIMGASGCGKSTLLNIVGGLDVPTEGHVLVNGMDLSAMSDDSRSDMRLRQIGFIFQSFNLFPNFSIEENVAWPLRFSSVSWHVARRKAAAALTQVGLTAAVLARRPAELSGGEQQRVAIARALVTEPHFILADEPTGNLDSHTGQAILDLLRSLNRERELTLLMVTHNAFAATYGHRTVEMSDGRVIRDVRAPAEHGRVVPLTR